MNRIASQSLLCVGNSKFKDAAVLIRRASVPDAAVIGKINDLPQRPLSDGSVVFLTGKYAQKFKKAEQACDEAPNNMNTTFVNVVREAKKAKKTFVV